MTSPEDGVGPSNTFGRGWVTGYFWLRVEDGFNIWINFDDVIDEWPLTVTHVINYLVNQPLSVAIYMSLDLAENAIEIVSDKELLNCTCKKPWQKNLPYPYNLLNVLNGILMWQQAEH